MLHSPFGVNMLIQETNNFSNVISEQPTSSKNDSCCCKGRKCDCASKQGGCRSVTLRPKSSSSPHLVGSNKKKSPHQEIIASITGPACDSSGQVFAHLFKPFCISQTLTILNQKFSFKRNPIYFSSYISIYPPPLDHPPKFS